MSDSGYIKEGERVTINRPAKEEPKKSSSDSGPVLFFFLLAFLAFLAFSSSSSSTSTPPLSTDVSLECVADIEIGEKVTVNANAARVRQLPGYLGKTNADTLHFMVTGEQAVVKDGPRTQDGLCWWFVEHKEWQGWIADHSSKGTILLSAVP